MPGHADPLEVDPAAAADFDQEDRHRDRDAETAIEHLVQVRVLRIVVGLDVAVDAEGLEDQAAHALGVGLPDLGGDPVETDQLAPHVEGAVTLGGDQQGGLIERDGLFGAGHQLPPPRIGAHQENCTARPSGTGIAGGPPGPWPATIDRLACSG